MTPQEFAAAYPKMLDWIHETLATYQRTARSVASMRFARLPLYFSDVLLQGTTVSRSIAYRYHRSRASAWSGLRYLYKAIPMGSILIFLSAVTSAMKLYTSTN
jgi:hypothetical protein